MTDLVTDADLSEAQESISNHNQDEGTNKFQKAISAWRSVDLTSLIPSLDSTASEIVQYQRTCAIQRKELSQRTKEFRRLDDSSKLVEIKALLKNYQSFIDLLTNHNKSTNSSFLSVYSSLSDVPDPYPLLEASVDSLLLSEDTLPKIISENKELQKTVRNLTSELEDAESKAEAESRGRRSLEKEIDTKIKEVENSWAEVLQQKKTDWEAKEKFFEEKINSQERLLSEIKASYEVTHRLSESEQNGNDQGLQFTSTELEIMSSDLERTSTRLAEVEARNEQLLFDLAQSASHLPSKPVNLEDDPGYIQIRSENASLLRKIEAAKVERDTKIRELDGKQRSLEREVTMLKEERENLRRKVQKWNDYDELKSELDILKSIEFSMGDDEDINDIHSDNQSSKSKGETLEQLLLARNKKLTDELTLLRVNHADLVKQIQNLQEELSRVKSDLESTQYLNSKLENDLASVHEATNLHPSSISVSGNHVNRYPQSFSNFARKGKISPTSSIISGFDPRSHISTPEAFRSGDSVASSSSILPMITAQRDRYKKRNNQLEHEISEAHNSISSLRQEISFLKKDNMNLYEKTRYISTYNRANSMISSTSEYTPEPIPLETYESGFKSPGSGLDRYRTAYETNLSPFAAFRGRESARAFKRMNLPERFIFSIARLVLATRTNRILFAGYCAVLHLLVFFCLYWLGSVDMEQSSSKLSLANAKFGKDR